LPLCAASMPQWLLAHLVPLELLAPPVRLARFAPGCSAMFSNHKSVKAATTKQQKQKRKWQKRKQPLLNVKELDIPSIGGWKVAWVVRKRKASGHACGATDGQ